jgi:chloramphenicol 3-O phosphotransferase
MHLKPFGTVIALNGPSSVGKTTLTRLLQERLSRPFLRLALDELIQMMPNQTNRWDPPFAEGSSAEQMPVGFCFVRETSTGGEGSLRLHLGCYAQQVTNSLHPLAACLAHQGLDVILDTVMLDPSEMESLQQALGPGVLLVRVGLCASVPTLEQRELQRGDRTAGSSRWQAERVHAGQGYDLFFDTEQATLDQIATAICREWQGREPFGA